MTKYTVFLRLYPNFSILHAQENENSALYKTIIAKDSLLFSVGFNTCNIEQTERLLKDSFEFYHDRSMRIKRNL